MNYAEDFERKYGLSLDYKESRIDKLFKLFYQGAVCYFLFEIPGCINGIRNNLILDSDKKYISIEEARMDLEIEKKKLGLENLKIDLEFLNSAEYIANAEGSLENGFKIGLGSVRNRQGLGHELYHI